MAVADCATDNIARKIVALGVHIQFWRWLCAFGLGRREEADKEDLLRRQAQGIIYLGFLSSKDARAINYEGEGIFVI